MNRIDFLKRIFLGGASLLLVKNVAVKPVEKTDVYLDSPYIAGFQYYKGLQLEPYLKEEDALTLKRDAKNKYDCYAVEVYRNEQKLGYLPRTDNKIIARMLDQGIRLNAKIRSIEPDTHPYRRVKIRVYSQMG